MRQQSVHDWPELMAFGFGVLRLPPEAFWTMTLKEVSAAAHAINGSPAKPVDRAWLDKIMLQHPDGFVTGDSKK